jgi:DtxR family Mn-dependent transcriptional regulator
LRLIIRGQHIYLSNLHPTMELLEKLTRRQVETLMIIKEKEAPDRGASLRAIASSLKITPPSALGHLTVLEEMGLVIRHRGKTRLTPNGLNALIEYQRHHHIAETLFSRMGFSPDEICAAAHEVDFALSHKTIEQLCKAAGHPEKCPHGEPIPPCSGKKSEN